MKDGKNVSKAIPLLDAIFIDEAQDIKSIHKQWMLGLFKEKRAFWVFEDARLNIKHNEESLLTTHTGPENTNHLRNQLRNTRQIFDYYYRNAFLPDEVDNDDEGRHRIKKTDILGSEVEVKECLRTTLE